MGSRTVPVVPASVRFRRDRPADAAADDAKKDTGDKTDTGAKKD